MQVTVSLMKPFSYSLVYVWIIAGIMLLPVLVFLIYKLIQYIKGRKNTPKKNNEKTFVKKDSSIVKKEYLEKLNELEAGYREKTIDERTLYIRLSSLVRGFVFEMTGIPVHTKTLSEIRNKEMPVLTELIEQYYTPEFARKSYSNPLEAIFNAKGIVEKWK